MSAALLTVVTVATVVTALLVAPLAVVWEDLVVSLGIAASLWWKASLPTYLVLGLGTAIFL